MLKSNAMPAVSGRVKTKTARSWKSDWPLNTILLIFALLTYIPFILVVVNSFKDNGQYLSQLWLPTLPLHPENYIAAFPPIWETILNSLS
jgi:ABC-type glycerol-3-phosphate transport system permease component